MISVISRSLKRLGEERISFYVDTDNIVSSKVLYFKTDAPKVLSQQKKKKTELNVWLTHKNLNTTQLQWLERLAVQAKSPQHTHTHTYTHTQTHTHRSSSVMSWKHNS